MKYYICGRIKWLCGIPAYKSCRYRVLYRFLVKFRKSLTKVCPEIPFFVKTEETEWGPIVKKIRLPEDI